jgi:hypothetical protein
MNFFAAPSECAPGVEGMKKSFGILICFMIGAGVLHAADDAKQPGNPLEDVFTGEAKASPAGTTSTAKQATRDWTARGFIIPSPPPVGGVYDDTLPKNPGELTVKPFEGERYAAEVPAKKLVHAQIASRRAMPVAPAATLGATTSIDF